MLGSDEYPENTYSSPFKIDPQAQEPQTDDDDGESMAEAPSSPFQYDGRDDTVDFNMLRQQQRETSLAPSEHSATPRKRSYEYAPDEQDGRDNTGFDGRYKKGNRRDESEIDIHADEDASFLNEQKATDDAGQQEAGSNSMMEEKHNEGMSTVLQGDGASDEKENHDDADNGAMTDDEFHDSIDDTHLSTFSAVPNADMTSFANLRRESPIKATQNYNPAPEPGTPSQTRLSNRRSTLIDLDTPAGSPSPRRRGHRDYGNSSGTPKILDLIDQPGLSPRPRYSMQNMRYSPERRSPLRIARESMRSPGKASLLDFDLPPPPTPRSIPTVTPRELESLKSSFMSEISSLKATLSGREAEVSSLKQAVADAERRVGEAMEQVRNEAARKDELEIEQAEWQRRGEEMETVLREVKADIVEGEHEKARLVKKVEEVEKSKEQLEGRMVELESQLEAARKAAEAKPSSSPGVPTEASTTSGNTKTAEETAREVQEAVEKVARELHTLYKGKHETKVAALKKSYESRWDKRVREAENKLKGVQEENQRMKEEREQTAVIEAATNRDEAINMVARANEEHEAEKRVLEAQIKGLQREMAALREDRERLHGDLEMERAEKGELVAAVDEWLAIQQPGQQPPEPAEPAERTERTPSPYDAASPEPTQRPSAEPVMEDFRRSVSHSTSASSSTSGLRQPSATGSSGGFEEKKKAIPKIGAKTPRGNSGGKSGIAVFTPGRSGIMGSIERMGRGV